MVIHDLRGPATSIQMGSDIALQQLKNTLSDHSKITSKFRNYPKYQRQNSFELIQGHNQGNHDRLEDMSKIY